MATPEEALRVISRSTEQIDAALISRGCREEEDRKDCIQEAALKLFDNPDKLNMGDNPDGFFYRIAINEWFDLQRKRQKVTLESLSAFDQDVVNRWKKIQKQDDPQHHENTNCEVVTYLIHRWREQGLLNIFRRVVLEMFMFDDVERGVHYRAKLEELLRDAGEELPKYYRARIRSFFAMVIREMREELSRRESDQKQESSI